MKNETQIPPMPTVATKLKKTSAQGICGLARSDFAGMTSQTRLIQCKARIHRATRETLVVCRLFSRNKRTKNGKKNWKTINPKATHCQPPVVRRKYQGISSVRLPLQMIRNWQNDM